MEGTPGTIRVHTRPTPTGQVEIEVADTGPGISDEIKEKLFEPFFTTKPGGKGTGLGLSVSFGIIKDHRGEIRVDSEPGEGSSFIVTLPTLEEFENLPAASTPDA
jgi:signal transduction histidine kinase